MNQNSNIYIFEFYKDGKEKDRVGLKFDMGENNKFYERLKNGENRRNVAQDIIEALLDSYNKEFEMNNPLPESTCH